MVHAGVNIEEILQHIIPLGVYDTKKCQAILSDAISIDDLVNSLSDQDFGFILKETMKNQRIMGDLSPLEAILDKEVYKGILIEINKLKRNDKEIATNILGIEIDALNVKIILKYKALMIDQEKIKENLMPSALIDEEILESAIREPDIKSVLLYFLKSVEKEHKVYQNVFTKLVKASDSPISRLIFILDKASLDMSFFELKKNMKYYNIGYLLGFLNMKWVEIMNLRCIVNGMASNTGTDQIHDLLILPEKF
jgi:vacuolar-type H+-ATPase subunit C/Vma6